MPQKAKAPKGGPYGLQVEGSYRIVTFMLTERDGDPGRSLSRERPRRGVTGHSQDIYGATPSPYDALSGALEAVLELSGAKHVVEACNRLSSILDSLAAESPQDIPKGARPDIHRLMAVLTFQTWEEVIRWAGVLNVDLRDLVESEIAYSERVTLKTAQRWRTEGDGPPYRNEAGIRYPVLWYWEWRRKGRQTTTAQRATRGRRSIA